MANQCKESGSLTKIDIETEASASACPMTAGGTSNHTVRIDNNRDNSIYEVQILVQTYRSKLDFPKSLSPGSPKDWYHKEPIISKSATKTLNCQMTAPIGSEGSDEVETRIELYDEKDREPGTLRNFSGDTEKVNLIYGIDVN